MSCLQSNMWSRDWKESMIDKKLLESLHIMLNYSSSRSPSLVMGEASVTIHQKWHLLNLWLQLVMLRKILEPWHVKWQTILLWMTRTTTCQRNAKVEPWLHTRRKNPLIWQNLPVTTTTGVLHLLLALMRTNNQCTQSPKHYKCHAGKTDWQLKN